MNTDSAKADEGNHAHGLSPWKRNAVDNFNKARREYEKARGEYYGCEGEAGVEVSQAFDQAVHNLMTMPAVSNWMIMLKFSIIEAELTTAAEDGARSSHCELLWLAAIRADVLALER